jgi:hypothetical protein
VKIIFKVLVIILALCFELIVLEFGSNMVFRSHGMMADAKYRREERLAAFWNYQEHPSPATKGAFQEELRLMHNHEDWKWQTALILFAVINGTWIIYYLCHERKTTPA